MKNEISRSSLFGAAAVVVAAALCFSYATYSWMTMDRVVKADNINLTVSAPNNIEISFTGTDVWSQELVVDMDMLKEYNVTKFHSVYSAAKSFWLLPASSYSALDDESHKFYYSTTPRSDGTLDNTSGIYADTGMKEDSTEYSFHYVDVPVSLRTADVTDCTLALEKTGTGISGADGTLLYKTARVAFLNEATNANSAGGADPIVLTTAEGAATTYVLTGTDYSVDKTTPRYLTWAAGTPSFSTNDICTLPAATYLGSTPTYTPINLILRIWIEGQDESCRVGAGKQSFSVSVQFTVK